MRFHYGKSANGKWFWHLTTFAGDVLAEDEGYTSKKHCHAAIKLVRAAMSSGRRTNPRARRGLVTSNASRLRLA
jgi:uncharacterized protein YegP (UPF0339 family)